MTSSRTVQQQACDTRRSVHLSASAGSGKTRALKDRYLALLDALDRRGLSIDQAVAITFTDKAAAEIKERVLQGLSEDMLRKIIRGSRDLRISTIHSFCMNLLKRYPLEAGLPPDFGVLDARDQAHKIRQAVEDALEASGRDRGLMAPLGGSTVDELVETLEFLLSIRSRLRRMEIDAGGPDRFLAAMRAGAGVDAAEQELAEMPASAEWRDAFTGMEALLRAAGDFYETHLGPLHAALGAARDARAVAGPARMLTPVYFTQKNEPRKKPFLSSAACRRARSFPSAEYEKLYFRVQDALSRFLAAHRLYQAGTEALSLLRLEQRAEELYQNAKLREGLLDFDDLEIYAYRLLQSADSPDILYWLDRRILHFLVDEFQDTSDIQWAIVHKLNEELLSGLGAEKGMPPTLFVVGDEKQSIYRFREANYRLLDQVRIVMEQRLPGESRAVLTLERNFRSAPEIVDTVNSVFSSLWPASYQPSVAHRTDRGGSVRLFELLPGGGEDEPDSREAELLARELGDMIARGLMVRDKDGEGGGRPRAVQYGDCAILIQSRTKLKQYEQALRQAGVPFRVVGGIGFYEEDEIQALLNVLFFLWNRDDRLACAVALKSPLFGLSDAELYELTRTGVPMLDALEQTRPDAAALLRAWIGLAGLVPLAALIHRIVADTAAYVRFGRRNAQALFNIDKLLDTAREFDRRGYTTLQDFVEWIKNIRAAEQREPTADMNLPGFAGAVSIMTVHKAKGLEYPVVFLPGMNQQPKSAAAGPQVLVESDDVVRMAKKDAANPLYQEMWEREKEELRREHQRLLYVAMTRARDHLVMIGALSDGASPVKQNTWLDCMHRTAPKPLFDNVADQPGARVYSLPRALASAERAPEERRPAAERIAVKELLENLAPVAPSQTAEWKRATDFVDRELPFEPPLPPSAETSVSPLVRGSVLHRCLEEYAKQGAFDLGRVIASFPGLPLPDSRAALRFRADAQGVLDAVLADRELAWIFARAPGAYAELPFLYKKGNSFISGVIDRMVIKDNKGFVVDYKAILVENDEALKAWVGHYRPQLRIYCEAVKDIFGLSAVEGSILFLDGVRLVPVVDV